MASITLSLNGKVVREIALTAERITIGRGPGNDLVLDNLAVSAEHAVIVAHDQDFFLEDLNSTNGTQVNGQPIKKHFLRDDDVIEIAQYRIKYRSQAPDGLRASGVAARIAVVDGPGAGKEIPLIKALTTIGRPGVQVAAIARREQGGYDLLHVDGNLPPSVNDSSIGTNPYQMVHGDMINIAGTRMRFVSGE